MGIEEKFTVKVIPPKKCVSRKDGKFYALIKNGYNLDTTKTDYYYLTPWENRFDWEKKGINPKIYEFSEFNEKFKLAE